MAENKETPLDSANPLKNIPPPPYKSTRKLEPSFVTKERLSLKEILDRVNAKKEAADDKPNLKKIVNSKNHSTEPVSLTPGSIDFPKRPEDCYLGSVYIDLENGYFPYNQQWTQGFDPGDVTGVWQFSNHNDIINFHLSFREKDQRCHVAQWYDNSWHEWGYIKFDDIFKPDYQFKGSLKMYYDGRTDHYGMIWDDGLQATQFDFNNDLHDFAPTTWLDYEYGGGAGIYGDNPPVTVHFEWYI